ncbi:MULTISPECIES: heavy metal translocating P-type ATPase [Massilia]|jgi:Zn2+/Cd2+-exporting ATPase|uniref:heavy metal translocating P-type ATPase n=1 Tax=Massilia TaxID=149698 RepID=UPI001C62EFA4|nr:MULTISPECIES: heavy metal translocating P-type ATPase [Massilia]QYF99984.1 heavy metal translocating P-type ATPase [Massilia sp. NP310]
MADSTSTLRLDIPILIPQVTQGDDAIVGQLLGELSGRIGVVKAHVKPHSDTAPAQLCIHYDPTLIPLARLRELVEASGVRVSERFGHLLWDTDGIGHTRRARTVSERLCALPGVLSAEASASGVVHIDFDRDVIGEDALLTALLALGVRRQQLSNSEVHEHTHRKSEEPGHEHKHGDGQEHEHKHEHGGLFGANTELIFALGSGAMLGAGFVVGRWIDAAPSWLELACYLAAYFFGGFYTLREAVDNLKLRRFEIDTLMLVAAAGAAALGSWAEGALLLFLFSLGHALEHYAMGRAKRAIEALAELAPETATVRRDGATATVQVEELVVGDIVLVKPNERLPADGFITAGDSAIDQAPVTGESIPVDKRAVMDAAQARARPDSVDANSRVFAGTINGAGSLEVEVTRRSGESALARVVKMVSEAETRKSPTQRLTDKFERIFVPAVLCLVVVLLFAWVVVDEPFRDSFYRAMSVLVAASPCALAIATPSAVLSGIARAARGGVLIKGGAPLEELGALNAMAFDKTGTLTEGRPRITDVVPVDGTSEEELLEVAVAVESLSDHPLAAAIARDGRERLGGHSVLEAGDLRNLIGRGVSAIVAGVPVWIGKVEMFGVDGVPALGMSSRAAAERLREAGRTTMVVHRGGRDLGTIGLLDTPRPGAREALQRLRELGIERMIMISGDHRKVADAIANDVGLDEAWGDLMPEDKVEAIRKLREQTRVAMVGDGVNDAPAMANATVGIAMGAAGSDVALETADVALMADDLRHLPFAVGLSRHTRRIIRQNVFVSLGVVAILIPATILGLGIGPAVAVHEGSTLLVVFNALRLLAYRGADDKEAAGQA